MTRDPAPKVVVMNDTSTRYHHGCARVMRLLVQGLESRGLTVTARSAARHEWAKDAAFIDALGDADLVVINGEGTLHHGKDAGRRLLDVATHPARRGKLALINALWQDNPSDWGALAAQFDLLSTRDQASADELTKASGCAVRMVPDLSLSAPVVAMGQARSGIIVGDSVKFDVRRALAGAAKRLDATFVPTKTLASPIWEFAPAKWALFCAYNGQATLAPPAFAMAADEAQYLDWLSKAEGHLTGRFHAVCLSLLTGTPFVAVTSNARKIEALLADAGLTADRIVPTSAVADLTTDDITRAFTDGEKVRIDQFLSRAQSDAAKLFDDLAILAHQNAGPVS
ncbi:polysaccharide pyruvyl transferase family protein [Celeribacter arenosi]|uniref:Polysaccharide pyruvyl transferase family protein n=1 Tax=Celeribacter arenosi TaxID=792649 RepID=A0ABP7JZ66_9RHOB